jgi:low affinity Fe/Cu permease
VDHRKAVEAQQRLQQGDKDLAPMPRLPDRGEEQRTVKTAFRRIAERASDIVASPWAFFTALAFVLLWLMSGPFLGFGEQWHFLVNTVSSVVTFLLVFLIQNTQNRDARAIHLKLNELIRAVEGAHTGLVNLEALSDEDLERLERAFIQHREQRGRSIHRIVQSLEGRPPTEDEK